MKRTTISIGPKAPCEGCSVRHLGCHHDDMCGKWAAYRKKVEQFKAERERNSEIVDYKRNIGDRIERYELLQKKKGRR